MSLKKYQQKRNFTVTPEPKGKIIKSRNKKLFIIQKHAASHLHYDFRIELNGVLKSWAVPKGPSLDPTIKRLAMHVEDHPIEYGGFEGIIPPHQYGAGTVMLWDKGTWECEDEHPYKAYLAGNLTLILKAKKLQGRWKLVRIKSDEKSWLLMKLKDEYAKPSKEVDITLAAPNSVLSKKSMDEITENYKKVWHSDRGEVSVKTSRKKKPQRKKSRVKKLISA